MFSDNVLPWNWISLSSQTITLYWFYVDILIINNIQEKKMWLEIVVFMGTTTTKINCFEILLYKKNIPLNSCNRIIVKILQVSNNTEAAICKEWTIVKKLSKNASCNKAYFECYCFM